MAAQVSNVLNVVWNHRIVSCGILLLLILPLFQVLVYFSPLLISTALCVAALVSIGPPAQKDETGGHDDTVSCKSPAHKEETTWLGWFKCARVWLESKFKIQERSSSTQDADLGITPEDEPDSTSSTGYVHDIRVRQLERTLRSLSFVSYEGIFASDGTLLLDDPERNTDDEEHKNITHVQDEGSPEVDVPASQHEDIVSNGTSRREIPVGPPRAASTNEQQEHQSSREHPSDMVSEDSSSWQEVEHEEPQ